MGLAERKVIACMASPEEWRSAHDALGKIVDPDPLIAELRGRIDARLAEWKRQNDEKAALLAAKSGA